MLEIEVDQNSEDWHRARIGIPTASEFGKMLTGTGKPSTQVDDYAAQLAAEIYSGVPMKSFRGNVNGGNLERQSQAQEGGEGVVVELRPKRPERRVHRVQRLLRGLSGEPEQPPRRRTPVGTGHAAVHGGDVAGREILPASHLVHQCL